jgi:hypothetical protein
MANNGTSKKSSAQIGREIDEVLLARQKRAAKTQVTKPRAPGQAEYEQRERTDAHRKITEVERAPLADRKEAQEAFLEAMRKHPDLVAERIGWLLDGNYGYGSKLVARRILASPRMNRSAALTHMIGAFEWQCPGAMAIAGWKKLSGSEQARLESAVQKVIRDAESA